MTKLDPEFKAKWVAALRSGEYKQGQKYLRTKSDAYCCLGVACKLLPVQWDGSASNNCIQADGYSGVMPTQHMTGIGLDEDAQNTLINMNDGAEGRTHTFAEIADYIEANL